MTPSRTNLLGLDLAGLKDFVATQGEKPFRATQLLKWIHQQGETDFDQMTNLSLAFREKLKAVAEVKPPELLLEQTSTDGTRKWVMQLPEGQNIETVLYKP